MLYRCFCLFSGLLSVNFQVIAGKTGSKSSAGGARIGLMKILSIYEETTETGKPKNTNLSTVTVSIKFPKE